MAETSAQTAITSAAIRQFQLPGGVALVILGVFAFATSQASRLLADPDTQWHVALGADILRQSTLPWVDTYSHTFAGAPFIAKEWLSQVLYALSDRVAGWAGVATLAALSLGVTFGGLYRWLIRRLQPTTALATVLVAALLTAPHWLARPHLLSFPVILLWVCGLVAAAERRSAPSPWLLGVMVLWANLHAGFTIGFALAGLVAVDAVLTAPASARRALAVVWSAFLAATPLAACLTPYGHHAMLITVTLFGSGEPLPYIVEWQPLAHDGCGLGVIVLMSGLPLLLLVEAPRRNLARVALLALLAGMTLRHARFLDLYALIAPVLVAAPLARLCPRLAAPKPTGPASRFGPVLPAVLLFGLVGAAALARPVEPTADVRPVAALAAARQAGLTGDPVFNDYDFGGFLIGQGVKTYVDGRCDQIFLGGFIRTLAEATARADPHPFLALLAGRGATWALVRTGSREAGHLAAGGWALVHADPVAAVYARP